VSAGRSTPLAAAIGIVLDRRRFLAASGGAALLAQAPLSVLAGADAVSAPESLHDWTIDDMWGVYPRYAEAIGFARPAPGRAQVVWPAAEVDPVDEMFSI
jgi:hypothetical protein